MRVSKILVLCLFVHSSIALALEDSTEAARYGFDKKEKTPAFDLIQESNSLPVLTETKIQEQQTESKNVVSFNVGSVQANNLALASNGIVTRYDLNNPTPVFGGGFGYYPTRFGGNWGLNSSFDYSYRQQSNAIAPSALHLFSIDSQVTYRYEPSSKSWIVPYAGAGPGVVVAYQRGIDQLNTSESHWVAAATIGVGLNLNRLFDQSNLLGWELTAQYKRWIDPSVSNADYNGQLITLGLLTVL